MNMGMPTPITMVRMSACESEVRGVLLVIRVGNGEREFLAFSQKFHATVQRRRQLRKVTPRGAVCPTVAPLRQIG